MSGLTQRELMVIEELLRAEEIAAARFQRCAAAFDDPEVNQICNELTAKHSEHYRTLLKQLNIYTEMATF